jgi:hypothetical protein
VFAALPPDRQDFPLNDDWAYSKGAFLFAGGQGLHYFRQGSMPLLGQWLLCCPVIHIAGESHVFLRLTTVAMSLLASLALYDLLRAQAQFSSLEASFAAVSFGLNPIVFLMSGTFMSDVPAIALSLLALDSYARALRTGSPWWLQAGVVLATFAAITRQNAIVTPIVAGLLLARDSRLRKRPAWLLGVVLPVVAGALAHFWFVGRPDAVPLGPTVPTATRVFVLIFAGSIYLGLSTLPMLALRPGISNRKWFVLALAAMAGGVWTCVMFGKAFFPSYAYHGGFFPYLENIITPWGTLESGGYVVGERPLMMGRVTQMLLTLAGCVGGAALLVRVHAGLDRVALNSPLVLYSSLHALLLVVSPTLYDRYLIVLMPGALAIAGAASFPTRWPIGLGVLALFAACSAGLMHDWLAWNSARWELGRRALARGVPADDIEGGLEWDSWYAPGDVASEGPPPRPRGFMLPFNRRRFPHITGRYALAFSQRDGTAVLDSQPYRLWLVPGEWKFLLLVRR